MILKKHVPDPAACTTVGKGHQMHSNRVESSLLPGSRCGRTYRCSTRWPTTCESPVHSLWSGTAIQKIAQRESLFSAVNRVQKSLTSINAALKLIKRFVRKKRILVSHTVAPKNQSFYFVMFHPTLNGAPLLTLRISSKLGFSECFFALVFRFPLFVLSGSRYVLTYL